MTNGDYIRQMDDETLAEYLIYVNDEYCFSPEAMKEIQQTMKDYPAERGAHHMVLKWLKEEAVILPWQRRMTPEEEIIDTRTNRIAEFTSVLYNKLLQRNLTAAFAWDIVIEIIRRIPIEDLY